MKRGIFFALALASLAGGWCRAGTLSDPSVDWIWETESQGHRPSLEYPIRYVLFYHAVGISVLAAMDGDDTNFDGPKGSNFTDGFTRGPKFDDDEWYFNYLAHPLWGSETYLRARSQGFDAFSSFLFSTASSVVWEFGFESWWQRPSYQDLMVTSTAGSLLGELRFYLKRQLLQKETPTNRVLATLVDPIQGITESVGKLFGRDWSEPAFRKAGDPALAETSPIQLDFGIVGDRPGLVFNYSQKF